jgi:hypothetical protein
VSARFLLVLVLAGAHIASAQHAGTSIALDGAAGGATGRGGEFLYREMSALHLAASVRHLSVHNRGVFAEVSADLVGYTGDRVDICVLRQDGSCVPPYPGLRGLTVLAGLIVAPVPPVELRVGLGAAGYHTIADGRRASRTVFAEVGAVDASVFLTQHVGLVGGIRAVAIPRYQGVRLSMRPWTIGIRVRFGRHSG